MNVDVVTIGGGVAGAALAKAVAGRGRSVLVLEREAKFKSNGAAWDFFGKQPPSYRQTAIYWVMNAKRDETRSKRLARLIEASAARRRL